MIPTNFPYTKGQVGVLFRNITQRKNAEQASKEDADRYRQLFSSMTEMFFVAELLFNEVGEVVDFVFAEANPVGHWRLQCNPSIVWDLQTG